MKRAQIALFSTLFFSLAASAAPVTDIKGTATFLAVGRPSLLKIKGEGAGLKGDGKLESKGSESLVSGTFKFELKTLKTGMGLRDKHMNEKYLQTDKYPEATLALAPTALTLGKEGPFEGDLTLKGVTKKVKGKAVVTQAADGVLKVKAEFPIKLTDYKVGIPSFAGITVAEDVDVTTEFAGKATPAVAATAAKTPSNPPKPAIPASPAAKNPAAPPAGI